MLQSGRANKTFCYSREEPIRLFVTVGKSQIKCLLQSGRANKTFCYIRGRVNNTFCYSWEEPNKTFCYTSREEDEEYKQIRLNFCIRSTPPARIQPEGRKYRKKQGSSCIYNNFVSIIIENPTTTYITPAPQTRWGREDVHQGN